jgi:hypothetical protein
VCTALGMWHRSSCREWDLVPVQQAKSMSQMAEGQSGIRWKMTQVGYQSALGRLLAAQMFHEGMETGSECGNSRSRLGW